MSTWLFQLDFQQGGGWEDVTTYVDYDTWHGKTATLWTGDLKPASAICNFHLKPTAALALKFINYNEPIKVYIKKDGSDYFLGYVRKDARIQITSKLDPIIIECIDRFYALQKKIFSSFIWEDYKICDPADTGHSIVHQLLVLAGLTTSDVANVTISKVIDYFVVEENMKEIPGNSKRYIKGESYFRFVDRNVSIGIGGDTYLNVITNLLFDFGYTFYFSASGKLTPYNYLPADTSNANYFRNTAATKNILGKLNISKKDSDFEGVDVRWYSVKSLPDPGLEKPILYQDITNPAANFKCMIELSAGEHYPGGADDDAVYIDFEIEGAEIVACDNVVLNLTYSGTVTTNTFTWSGRRAKVDLENTGAGTAYIKRFDITGEAIIKDQDHIAKCRLVVDTEKVVEFKSEYIRDVADAEKLASGLSRYYIYGNRQFSLISMENFNIGDFVTIDDDLILPYEQICVVIQKRHNEVTGEHEYLCESIENYSLETVTHDRIHRMPRASLSNTQGFADNFLLLSTSTGAIISYSGSNPASPAEGDRRVRLCDGEYYHEEFTGGTWTMKFQLGSALAALGLAVGLGVCNPWVEDPGTEPFPGKDFRIFNFENNYEDQNGVDDWIAKSYCDFDNTIKKFNSYSLFATEGNYAQLRGPSDGIVGYSQVLGVWFYFSEEAGGNADTNANIIYISGTTPGNADVILIDLYYDSESTWHIRFKVYKNGSTVFSYVFPSEITENTWHYIAFSYNSDTDIIDCIVNNELYTSSAIGGTWQTPDTMDLIANTRNSYVLSGGGPTISLYLDELIYYYNNAIDPNILIQHYNHNIPWEVAYSAHDTVMLPGPFGRCYLQGPVKINDDAWYSEETLGIPHLLKAEDRSGSADYADSSLSAAWETVDFSSLVESPSRNVTAITAYFIVNWTSAITDGGDIGLYVREYGSSEAAGARTRLFRIEAAQNSDPILQHGGEFKVLAPGGKFQISVGATTVDNLSIYYRGCYTNG